MLTSFSDQPRVADALTAGAVGYLLKDCDPRDLLAAVRLPRPRATRRSTRGWPARCCPTADDAPSPADGLSAREREVLRLVAQGLANKQIGRALGISERTVKAHLGQRVPARSASATAPAPRCGRASTCRPSDAAWEPGAVRVTVRSPTLDQPTDAPR